MPAVTARTLTAQEAPCGKPRSGTQGIGTAREALLQCGLELDLCCVQLLDPDRGLTHGLLPLQVELQRVKSCGSVNPLTTHTGRWRFQQPPLALREPVHLRQQSAWPEQHPRSVHSALANYSTSWSWQWLDPRSHLCVAVLWLCHPCLFPFPHGARVWIDPGLPLQRNFCILLLAQCRAWRAPTYLLRSSWHNYAVGSCRCAHAWLHQCQSLFYP
mmetsp:Transcript_3378/g.5570  ORF Transcript_3378/g.5570 Transcript_3378/m.5570 type:complete len:215 (-) Transcript_3378:1555-2199(-)